MFSYLCEFVMRCHVGNKELHPAKSDYLNSHPCSNLYEFTSLQ